MNVSNVSTVKISREGPVEGLYQLLAATESLQPDRIARESEIEGLNDRIAEPLRGMIELALEFVAEIETAIHTSTHTPPTDPRPVSDACFSCQRDLRRALRELGLSNCTIGEAIARCETAANRVRASLTAMVASMGERDRELPVEKSPPTRRAAGTAEPSVPEPLSKPLSQPYFIQGDGQSRRQTPLKKVSRSKRRKRARLRRRASPNPRD